MQQLIPEMSFTSISSHFAFCVAVTICLSLLVVAAYPRTGCKPVKVNLTAVLIDVFIVAVHLLIIANNQQEMLTLLSVTIVPLRVWPSHFLNLICDSLNFIYFLQFIFNLLQINLKFIQFKLITFKYFQNKINEQSLKEIIKQLFLQKEKHISPSGITYEKYASRLRLKCTKHGLPFLFRTLCLIQDQLWSEQQNYYGITKLSERLTDKCVYPMVRESYNHATQLKLL